MIFVRIGSPPKIKQAKTTGVAGPGNQLAVRGESARLRRSLWLVLRSPLPSGITLPRRVSPGRRTDGAHLANAADTASRASRYTVVMQVSKIFLALSDSTFDPC